VLSRRDFHAARAPLGDARGIDPLRVDRHGQEGRAGAGVKDTSFSPRMMGPGAVRDERRTRDPVAHPHRHAVGAPSQPAGGVHVLRVDVVGVTPDDLRADPRRPRSLSDGAGARSSRGGATPTTSTRSTWTPPAGCDGRRRRDGEDGQRISRPALIPDGAGGAIIAWLNWCPSRRAPARPSCPWRSTRSGSMPRASPSGARARGNRAARARGRSPRKRALQSAVIQSHD